MRKTMSKAAAMLASLCLLLLLLPMTTSVSAWTPYDYEDKEKKTIGPLTYVIVDGEAIIYKCDRNTVGAVHIPPIIDGCPVTQINFLSFEGCKGITEVVLPDSVTKIVEQAFMQCTRLKRINFPPALTQIGIGAFLGCSALEEVTFPDGLKEILFGAFSGCASLKKVALPEGLEVLSVSAFGNCTSLAEISVPESVDRLISASTFHDTAYWNDKSNWKNGTLYIGNALVGYEQNGSKELLIRSGTSSIDFTPLYPYENDMVVYFEDGEAQWERLTKDWRDEGVKKWLSQITVHYYTNGKAALSRVAITRQPDKTTYIIGREFSDTGMQLTAYYEDGSSRVVTGYTVSGYTQTVGKQTLTVTYGGQTAQLTVEVTPAPTTTTTVPTTTTTTKATTTATTTTTTTTTAITSMTTTEATPALPSEPSDTKPQNKPWLWVGIGGGAAAIGTAVAVWCIVAEKKRKTS